MKIYNMMLLLILTLVQISARAFDYQEQPLEPVTAQTESNQDTRLLAPKTKTYPFLNQLEALIYPSKNFRSENPGQRLDRLEVAVFGAKQNGNIGARLNNLQSELNNWQIGNMPVKKAQGHKAQGLNAPGSKLNERISYQQYNSPTALNHRALSVQHSASRDYDYMNYRLATPLIQNIGRRTIDAMFK